GSSSTLPCAITSVQVKPTPLSRLTEAPAMNMCRWRLLVGFALALLPFFVLSCHNPSSRVVVYCAHDKEFADEILKQFEKVSGLTVAISYDTEANKSVGLYDNLVREASQPRCDVHWNNEIL